MLGKQRRKATTIDNSIKICNNLSQSNAYSNYWSPLTGLVEGTDDNIYYDFSHVLQNKSASGKPDTKAKSPPPPTEKQAMNGVLEMEKKWMQCCWNLSKSTAPLTNISIILNLMMTNN